MSKVSIFKFNINNYNISEINNIIGEYLGSRGFYYNQEKNCYTTGTPTSKDVKKNIATSVGLSVASSLLTGGATIVGVSSIEKGFEFQVNGNQLIIKAYLIDNKFDSKQYIHSTFNSNNAAIYYYSDLRQSLFKKLEENNIVYVSKEIEKINDGSEQKRMKLVLIIIGLMFLIPFLLLLILL